MRRCGRHDRGIFTAGSFAPVTDMVGRGPFGLLPGEWTDDTTMALCLADSLISKDGFDAHDQMTRKLYACSIKNQN
jgi:ADP-ribosylglycohydrolase